MRAKSLNRFLLIAILLVGVARQAAGQATYPTTFRVDPLTALKQASALPKRATKPLVTAREYSLLQDATTGQMGRWMMADAALVVAGVPEGPKHDQYRAQLEDIARESEAATAKATTPEAKAKLLARYLITGPLQAGYVSGQYDVPRMLETGKFNCVSSAILFNIMAQRVGIDAVAVQVPRHVFSRVGDVDVETTSGQVYPVSVRVERYTKKRKEDDDREGAPYARRVSKETDSLGLLAEVYYDSGCDHSDAENYGEAIVAYLKAACLDSQNPNVARNLNNAFKRWFKQAVKNRQYAEAATIARYYRQLLRDPADADALMRDLQQTASR